METLTVGPDAPSASAESIGGIAPYHPERVRERAEGYIAKGAYASVEWHIEQGGRTRSEGRVGLADPLTATELAEVPIYRIFSMTKPLVAAAGVMLIDEGKLRLSDPIAQYVPEFASVEVLEADGATRAARVPLLVEHLFTHRSGLTYQWQQGNPVAPRYLKHVKYQDEHSLEDLVTSLAVQPLIADPGTVWHYSYSIDVLAQIVSLIEGKPLPQVLSDRLFGPVGTTDTGYFVPEAERARILPMFAAAQPAAGAGASGTLEYAPPAMLYPADDPGFSRGGLGLFSTLPDFVKLARFLMTGKDSQGARILSRAGIKALWTNRLSPSQMPISVSGLPKYQGYGFGLGGRVLVHPNQSLFYSEQGEAGWEGAGATYFWLDATNDVTGVVLAQSLGQKHPLGEDIRSAYYQALV